ncbi:MAG: CHAT domain-containing protein [Steroidobacteraceae bacterium]|nr:CHAT domain-containing protein [Steroidobacteraceae bacterium]
MMRSAVWLALLASCAVGNLAVAADVPLPATCQTQWPLEDAAESVAALKQRIETVGETDPLEAVRIMCATIPRVVAEYGADSLEIAWWTQSLATPLIAYLEKFAEARALLEFAEPLLQRHLGADAPEIAELHVANAWMAFREGRLARAADEWRAALRIRELVPGARQIELQKILVGLAQVELSQRNFQSARQLLERAQRILAANNESVSEAAAAIENALANVALREERFATARQHAEALLAIERQLPHGPAQLVPAYVLLGRTLQQLDEFVEAENAAREAVRLAESNDGPLQRHQLAALTQLASLLNARGKPREALPFAVRALTVGEAELGAAAPALVGVIDNVAAVHRALGELPAALGYYERSAAIIESQRADVPRQVLAGHYRGLGSVLAGVGELAAADAAFAKALAVVDDDATLSMERAAALVGQAQGASTHDPARAETLLDQALQLFTGRLPPGHPALLRVTNELCAVEISLQRAATPHCTQAAAMLRAAREADPGLRHDYYANAASLALQQGDSAAAYDLAVRALAAAETLGTPDPAWRARFQLARLLQQRGNHALAILFGKQSLAEIESLRTWFQGAAERLEPGFLRDKVSAYRSVADWLMAAGRIDEGLQVLALLKAEELYDFVLRDASVGASGGTISLNGAEQDLWSTYASLLRADAAVGQEIERLARLAEADLITPTEQHQLDRLLTGQTVAEFDRARRIQVFVAEQSSTTLLPKLSREVTALGLAGERARFGEDSAIGVYLLTETHLRLIIATSNGQTAYETPVDAAALRLDIGRYLDAISRREDVSGLSRSLYDLLAKPLDEAARRAGARLLVLWPDGVLRYLPFAALHDGSAYLAEKYALQLYAPMSAASATGQNRSRALSVRGFGVTQAVAGFDALPGVADELCYVVRGPIAGLAAGSRACTARDRGDGALDGEGYADLAFTADKLTASLKAPSDFSVLHIGTHFSLRPGNALRSFLVLGDGSRLTLDRIRTLDFQGLELATLSGCQTAMGGATTDDGREIEGLSAIVQQRGAGRVLATLWRVPDASTATLMHELYDRFGSEHQDVATALQRAQLSLLHSAGSGVPDYSHPYFWAGFALSGTWR